MKLTEQARCEASLSFSNRTKQFKQIVNLLQLFENIIMECVKNLHGIVYFPIFARQTYNKTLVNKVNMLYSRHQLDKAGQALIGTDPFLRNKALPTIQTWRETHFYVLQELNKQLLALFEQKQVFYEFSSMRIKRMTSIEAKLRNNKGTQLGGLQDIGGIRFVLGTIEQLDIVVSILNDFKPASFSLVRYYNYVETPKESGYRSVHYVYKYSSDDQKYNGISIELQVRTKMQHAWAMAVETASLISQTTLKADIKDNSEWRGFFKLVSALFAKDENKPVYETFSTYTQVQYCKEYFQYEQNKLVDQLKALQVTVNRDYDKDTAGYCVLTIDFISKIVHIQTFSPQQEKDATELFNQIECTINRDEAALIVAIENMMELKEAYPSYFLDTNLFFIFLSNFESRCRLLLGKSV